MIYLLLLKILLVYKKNPGFFEKNQNVKEDKDEKNLGQKYWSEQKSNSRWYFTFTKIQIYICQKNGPYFSKAKNIIFGI